MGIANPFIIKSAVLTTNRLGKGRELSYEIRSAIVDLNIFENIALPYTTAQIGVADVKDILSGLDIQGGEYIDLLIEPSQEHGHEAISKRYHITKILQGSRAGENAEAIVFQCIDEIGFRSYLKNVNVLLKGTALEMIVQLANEYLNTDVIHNEEKYEQMYKIIVPNLTPLKAMMWVNNKAITTIGMPHFLFASFADNALRHLDLEELLLYPPVNPNSPFTYGFNAGNSKGLDDYGNQTLNIQSFTYKDNHDIASIIENGFLSANHSYFDTLRNRQFNHDFKASKDVFSYMAEAELFDPAQQRYPLAPDMTMDDELLEEYNSRNVYNIGTTNPWDAGFTTLGERLNNGSYINETTNEAVRQLMYKDTLSWKFDGKHFGQISGGSTGAHLIGKKLRVIFSKADPDIMSDTNGSVDMKKSGDYLITEIKHMLNKETYRIVVDGCKLSTLNSSQYTKGL